jgi:hypothetical protein
LNGFLLQINELRQQVADLQTQLHDQTSQKESVSIQLMDLQKFLSQVTSELETVTQAQNEAELLLVQTQRELKQTQNQQKEERLSNLMGRLESERRFGTQTHAFGILRANAFDCKVSEVGLCFNFSIVCVLVAMLIC